MSHAQWAITEDFNYAASFHPLDAWDTVLNWAQKMRLQRPSIKLVGIADSIGLLSSFRSPLPGPPVIQPFIITWHWGNSWPGHTYSEL